MMDVFVIMVWSGGFIGAPDSLGFWRAMFWPWYLGAHLSRVYAEARP